MNIFYKKIYTIIFLIISFNIFADATSSVLTNVGTGAAIGAGINYGGNQLAEKNFPELSQKFGNFMKSPFGIAAISSIGMINSYTLYGAANDQIETSENNIKKIEKLMQTFSDTWTDYCPNGRNDFKEPTCYCYLENGKKNENRTNSESCKSLWAKNSLTNTAQETNYSTNNANSNDVSGCLTNTGAFDADCKCKRVLDKNGRNACQKIATISTTLPGSMANFSNISKSNNLIDTVNQLASGNLKLSNLNGKTLAINNTKVQEALIPINKASEENLKKVGIPGLLRPVDVEKIQHSLISKKDLDAGSKLFSSNNFSTTPNNKLKEAIKTVEQKSGLELSNSGKGMLNKKDENKAFNLSFNEQNNNQGPIEISSEQKVYKIKSDISKNSDASLFEIISNRYLESGLKRLFPEDK